MSVDNYIKCQFASPKRVLVLLVLLFCLTLNAQQNLDKIDWDVVRHAGQRTTIDFIDYENSKTTKIKIFRTDYLTNILWTTVHSEPFQYLSRFIILFCLRINMNIN